MGKTVIFCADGTWNGPGEPDGDDATAPDTNVFKAFTNLDGQDILDSRLAKKEREKTLSAPGGSPTQVAKYLHGVGDSNNFLVKELGGVLGAGLIARVVRGYTYVSRNYTPGDRIILIGFSRGAYTARALAGLITAKGLLDSSKLDLNDKEGAYKLGTAVWYDYRRAAPKATNWLGQLETAIAGLPGFFLKPPPATQLLPATIQAVAVWDTVGSLGIPDYAKNGSRLDAFEFADTKLSPNVSLGFQAIAVDELRGDFTPTLWDADRRVVQALFPGAHADVGGGYPTTNSESGLSDNTLEWMTANLTAIGVHFLQTPAYRPAPSHNGPAHAPWLHAPWNVLDRAARTFPGGLQLAQYVLDRVNDASVVLDPGTPATKYAPSNLGEYIADGAALTGVMLA
jgi:uncharacterized protein (DUF2235 family)